MRVMWLVAGYMAMPIDHLTKHRQCSIRVTAAAVWRCKRWLSLNRESSTDIKSAGGHRVHLTTDAHGHCHHPYRPIRDEQPPHGAYAAHVNVREVSGHGEERPLNLAGGGRRGRRYACGDPTDHASQWTSVAGRAGAVDGLIHHVGGARLQNACVGTQGT